jgi:hypothetical protein
LEKDLLVWQGLELGGGVAAEKENGAYRVGTTPYGAFGASFRPVRDPLSMDSKPLGEFETLEQAKVKCEQHYSENG